MRDERFPNVDEASWACQSLAGRLMEWMPKAIVRNVTSSTNINPLDGFVRADATSGAITLTLETAVGCDGRIHIFKKIDSSANAVTLDGNSSETIDGATTFALSDQYDAVILVSNGVNWDIATIGAGSGGSSTVLGTLAQCQLNKVSSNLVLTPYKGNALTFPSGVTVEVPSAGVSLSTSGLSSSTLYRIYAVTSDDLEVTSLEASTTGHVTDSGSGIEIKSGDSTRVLVGLARTNGSTQWVDAINQRFTRSWFNDRGFPMSGPTTGDSTTSTSGDEFGGGLARCEFVAWANETVSGCFEGYARHESADEPVILNLTLDGTILGYSLNRTVYARSTAADDEVPFSVSVPLTTTEGYHYFSGLFYVGTGTGWASTAAVSGFLRGLP